MRRGSLVAVLVLGMLSLPAPAFAVGVNIRDNSFDPAGVTIDVGETVSWTNVGNLDHDVSGNGFGSPTLGPGASYSKQFNTAGDFFYGCSFHQEMSGKVVVNPAPAPPPQGGQSPTSGGGGGGATTSPTPRKTTATGAPTQVSPPGSGQETPVAASPETLEVSPSPSPTPSASVTAPPKGSTLTTEPISDRGTPVWAWVVIALAGVSLLGGGGFYLWRRFSG